MKYLLDTDVVSQYVKPNPHSQVDAWIQRIDDRDLYICDVVLAELWYGASRLPAGKRRTALETWIEDDLYMHFFNRVLFLGLDTCRRYGALLARTEKNGYTPGAMDALIAATAAQHGMTLATLNRKHFEPFGIDLVDF